MLTPEKIAAFDKIAGVKSPPAPPTVNSRAAEVRALSQKTMNTQAGGDKSYMENIKGDAERQYSHDYPELLNSMEQHISQANPFAHPGKPLENIKAGAEGALGLASDAYKTLSVPVKGITSAVENIPAVQKFANSPVVSTTLKGYEDIMGKVSKLAETHPNIANLMTVVLGTLGAQQAQDVDLGKLQHTVNQATSREVGKATEAVGEGVKEVGNTFKAGARKLYEHAITPNTQEAEDLLRYRAGDKFLTRVKNSITGEAEPPQTRGSTAMEHGIAGTEESVGVGARRASQKIWKETVEPALDNSKAVMSKEELFSPIERRISNTIEPAKRAAFQNAYDALQDEYKGINNIPIKDAQNIKVELDRFTPDKVWRGKPIANEYKVLQNDMANGIRTKIYDALGPEVQDAYVDYGNLKELENVGVKAISSAATKGGSGTLVKGMWDAATVPIKTIAGKALYKVGNAFEFVGEKGIKTFGQYLESKGFDPPLVTPPQGDLGPNKGNETTDLSNGPNSNQNINDGHGGIIDKVKEYVKHPKMGNSLEDVSGGKDSIASYVKRSVDLQKQISTDPDMIRAGQTTNVTGQIETALKNIKDGLPRAFPDSPATPKIIADLNKLKASDFSSLDELQSHLGNLTKAFSNSFDTGNLPEFRNADYTKNSLLNLPKQYQNAYQAGEIPREQLYGSPIDPTNLTLLNPKYATSLAGEIASRLNLFDAKLGSKFLESITPFNTTEQGLFQEALRVIQSVKATIPKEMGAQFKALQSEVNGALKDVTTQGANVISAGGRISRPKVEEGQGVTHKVDLGDGKSYSVQEPYSYQKRFIPSEGWSQADTTVPNLSDKMESGDLLKKLPKDYQVDKTYGGKFQVYYPDKGPVEEDFHNTEIKPVAVSPEDRKTIDKYLEKQGKKGGLKKIVHYDKDNPTLKADGVDEGGPVYFGNKYTRDDIVPETKLEQIVRGYKDMTIEDFVKALSPQLLAKILAKTK